MTVSFRWHPVSAEAPLAAILPATTPDDRGNMERAHPRGEPPARRHNAPWADSLFAALTQGAAWLTLALLAGIIVSLLFGAAPAISW